MKRKMPSGIEPACQKRRPIRTTLLEVLKEITALTHDDALVLAVSERVLNSHRVRLIRTLSPVKIVAPTAPVAAPRSSQI